MEEMVRADFNHLSQTELIRFLDDEMLPDEREAAVSHMDSCAACIQALKETDDLLQELMSGEFSEDRSSSDVSTARALLKAKLIQPEDAIPERLLDRIRTRWENKWLSDSIYGMAAAASVVILFFGVPRWNRSIVEVAEYLPNHALTPGMTRPVDVGAMCSTDDDDLDPTVPFSLQRTVFREYGISIDHSQKDFQVDYLISPQLGGTDDVRNLWPQAYTETKWNARAKDDLERHLYHMVCEKKISLSQAQHEIATNWIAAYQKYFRTSEPT
jgi:hypothetical protein